MQRKNLTKEPQLYTIAPDIFKITILIPLYNEGDNVIHVFNAIDDVFKNINNCDYEIFFVDDGSTDDTLTQLNILESEYKNISYVSFSRNFGKDAALLAGFQYLNADADAVITMDGDMQHPPSLIPVLLAQWQNGYDIVYTYREDKNHHSSFFSRLSSKLFYWMISTLADIKLENGLSDFKLIDKKVLKVIKHIKEDAPFFRGLFKWVGFNQIGIPYKANARNKGGSKYPTKALIRLALHSITSFSTKPLTIAIYIGFFTSFVSILYIPYILLSVYEGHAISGWASTIATIAFFGGMQLIVLGIIGLYLGKLFIQSKNRPQYIVNESKLAYNYFINKAPNEKNKAMDTIR